MKKAPVNSPKQIIDKIKKQTKPQIWSKDLRNWYVAEIMDLVGYNLRNQRKEITEKTLKMLEEVIEEEYGEGEEVTERIKNRFLNQVVVED